MRWHEASRGLFATAELLVPLRSVRMSVWDQPGLAASLSGFVGNTTLPSRGPNTFSALCPMTFPAGKKLATTNNFPSRDWAWPIPTSRLDFHTIWVKWPAEVTTVSHDSWVMSRAACLNPLWAQSNGQQYGDWYTGPWWVGCYIWYSEESLRELGPRPIPSSLYQM